MRVKTSEYDPFRLESDVRSALERRGRSRRRPNGYVGEWFAPQAAAELLDFRSLLDGTSTPTSSASSSPGPHGRRG